MRINSLRSGVERAYGQKTASRALSGKVVPFPRLQTASWGASHLCYQNLSTVPDITTRAKVSINVSDTEILAINTDGSSSTDVFF